MWVVHVCVFVYCEKEGILIFFVKVVAFASLTFKILKPSSFMSASRSAY